MMFFALTKSLQFKKVMEILLVILIAVPVIFYGFCLRCKCLIGKITGIGESTVEPEAKSTDLKMADFST